MVNYHGTIPKKMTKKNTPKKMLQGWIDVAIFLRQKTHKSGSVGNWFDI